jgi:DNA-directed RNA polymerase subunit RPC12/RpoP
MGLHSFQEIESPITADMFYWFLEDPVFMQKVIFDRDLHPAQRLQTRLMWFNPMYVDNSGYRFGKSSNATYVQMCQCLLIPGWQSGILSHTLSGGKYLFRDHIAHEYDTNPLFRALVRKKPTMGNEWRIEFTNGSSITAFPPNILNNSLTLESLSLHDATIDESTAFGKPEVLWDVMFNRITMPVPPFAQKLGISNCNRVLGAAKYRHQLIYRAKKGRGGLVTLVIKRMLEWAATNMEEPMEDVWMSFNLEEHLQADDVCWACGGTMAPVKGKEATDKPYVQCERCKYKRVAWQKYLKGVLRAMRNAKSLMPKRLYDMRWGGKWQDSSDDVYPKEHVQRVPQPYVSIETRRPPDDEEAIYAVGVDIGTGATERHSVSGISVIKAMPHDPVFRYVYAEKVTGRLSKLSGRIYDIYERFMPRVIMVDPGGGGIFLVDKEHLANTEQTIITAGSRVKRNETTPLVPIGDMTAERGAHVVSLFTPKCALLEASIGAMKASDQMINWGHETVAGLLENRMLVAPITMAGADRRSHRMVAEAFGAINEALEGLMAIGIVEDQNGDPDLTRNRFFQYDPKPDLAYSLVYCVAGLVLYRQADLDRLGEMPEESGISVLAVPMMNAPGTVGRIKRAGQGEASFAIVAG